MAGLRQVGVLAWLHLARIFNKMQQREAEHLRPYRLTVPQFDVLAQVHGQPGMSQSMLAARLFVTKGNVCGLIDRLTAAGLIERQTDAVDRRTNRLFLTTAGEELARKVVPAHEDFIQQQMAQLPDGDQQALRGLLRRLDRALEPR